MSILTAQSNATQNQSYDPVFWRAEDHDSHSVLRVKRMLRNGELVTNEMLVAMLVELIADRSDWVERLFALVDAVDNFNADMTEFKQLHVAIANAKLVLSDCKDFINHRGVWSYGNTDIDRTQASRHDNTTDHTNHRVDWNSHAMRTSVEFKAVKNEN